MCSLDFSDGYVRLLSASSPVARKRHQCRECRRDIVAAQEARVAAGRSRRRKKPGPAGLKARMARRKEKETHAAYHT